MTQVHDGGAQYAAIENERIKNERLAQENNYIRETIKQDYLQRHTIEPQTSITGKINLKFKKGEKIKIFVPINKIQYEFLWTTSYGQKLVRKRNRSKRWKIFRFR